MLAGEVAELLDEIKRDLPPGASVAHQHLDVFRPVFFPVFGSISNVWPLLSQAWSRSSSRSEKMPGFMGRRVRPALRADEGKVQRSSKRAIGKGALGPKLVDTENGEMGALNFVFGEEALQFFDIDHIGKDRKARILHASRIGELLFDGQPASRR